MTLDLVPLYVLRAVHGCCMLGVLTDGLSTQRLLWVLALQADLVLGDGADLPEAGSTLCLQVSCSSVYDSCVAGGGRPKIMNLNGKTPFYEIVR